MKFNTGFSISKFSLAWTSLLLLTWSYVSLGDPELDALRKLFSETQYAPGKNNCSVELREAIRCLAGKNIPTIYDLDKGVDAGSVASDIDTMLRPGAPSFKWNTSIGTEDLISALDNLKPGEALPMSASFGEGPAHYFTYYKSKDGTLALVDKQAGEVLTGTSQDLIKDLKIKDKMYNIGTPVKIDDVNPLAIPDKLPDGVKLIPLEKKVIADVPRAVVAAEVKEEVAQNCLRRAVLGGSYASIAGKVAKGALKTVVSPVFDAAMMVIGSDNPVGVGSQWPPKSRDPGEVIADNLKEVKRIDEELKKLYEREDPKSPENVRRINEMIEDLGDPKRFRDKAMRDMAHRMNDDFRKREEAKILAAREPVAEKLEKEKERYEEVLRYYGAPGYRESDSYQPQEL